MLAWAREGQLRAAFDLQEHNTSEGKVHEFRRRAQTARLIAVPGGDSYMRAALTSIAKSWTAMADEREGNANARLYRGT